MSEGRPRMARLKLRNTGSKRRKTKDGRIGAEETRTSSDLEGSCWIWSKIRNILPKRMIVSVRVGCHGFWNVKLATNPRGVGLESLDPCMTTRDVKSGGGRSSSGGLGGWPGGLDNPIYILIMIHKLDNKLISKKKNSNYYCCCCCCCC